MIEKMYLHIVTVICLISLTVSTVVLKTSRANPQAVYSHNELYNELYLEEVKSDSWDSVDFVIDSPAAAKLNYTEKDISDVSGNGAIPSQSPSPTLLPALSASLLLPPSTRKTVPPATPRKTPVNTPKPLDKPKASPIKSPSENLFALKNSDVIGWLTLDGTTVSYPLLQSSDDAYYLDHDEYKNYSKAGSIFLDYRLQPDFSNANNIIYGHNLNASDKGLSELVKFKDKSFFDTHKTGTIYTRDKTYKLEIFSVYVSSYIGNPYTWYFINSYSFDRFVDGIKVDSLYFRDMDINYGDSILTLSTCSYEFKNARTVVHAKIMEE